MDNDCDGALDEDYVPHPVSCGIGACAASGRSACVAGQEQDDCAPREPVASDLSCNGVDDDCNGQVDEDVIKLAEVCNGIDDNCDQRVDEGLACSGAPAPGCVPRGPELCNGLDDDCDGRYDEERVCGVTPQPGGLLGVYWDCADAACTSLGSGGMMFLEGGTGLKLETFDHGNYDPAAGPYCVERPFQYSLQANQLTLVWQDEGSQQRTAQGTFQISGAHLSVSFSSGPADMLGSFQLVRAPEQAGGAC
ncbi:MAG TPA: MopE-related protein, partial [Polyangiales bacterium]